MSASKPVAGTVVRTFEGLVERATALVNSEGRAMLAISGPPGAGKSTLASRLEESLRGMDTSAPLVAQLPMDGFHLPNSRLREMGLSDRKGAPETFDVEAFSRLLGDTKHHPEGVVHAPSFSRELNEPVPGQHTITPAVSLVMCEGNYLLLGSGRWAELAGLFDETWFVTVNAALARKRLVERQLRGGRSLADAEAWVERSDLRNLDLVLSRSLRPDVLVCLPDNGALGAMDVPRSWRATDSGAP